MGDQRRPRRRRRLELGPQRRLGEDRAHARPHRLRREGVGAVGAERRPCRRAARRRCGRSCRRCRGRRRRAGRRRARAGASAQRSGQTAIARVPEPSVETSASSSGSTSSPPRPAPAAVEHEARLGAGGQPGLEQVLALGREQPLALAVLALAQLADQLQLLVLGACDHRFGVVVCLFWSAVSSPGTKKRAVFTARPGEWSVGVPLGGRTLPG